PPPVPCERTISGRLLAAADGGAFCPFHPALKMPTRHSDSRLPSAAGYPSAVTNGPFCGPVQLRRVVSSYAANERPTGFTLLGGSPHATATTDSAAARMISVGRIVSMG